MKTQQLGRNNITSKGLYFAKAKPLNSQYFNYTNRIEQKLSQQGIKYLEDNLILSNIKEKISGISIIKQLAKKFDTFVVYNENKEKKIFNPKEEEFLSVAEIYIAKNPEKEPKRIVFWGRDDNSILTARENCLENIKNKLQMIDI